HGSAGNKVVIEDFVTGNELALHVLPDGKNFSVFPASQDYKRLMDGDAGPNTGGMGAFAPVPRIEEFSRNSSFNYWVSRGIVEPAILGLEKRGRPFVGCLYPGLKGWKVLEFNSRFGDPEAEIYMRLLKTDLLDLLEACIEGRLDQSKIEWFPGYAVCVVMASKGYGYSESFPTCLPVNGIDRAQQVPGVIVFHAGTSRDSVGNINTAGGRVLAVTCHAETLKIAIENVYEAVRHLHFPGAYYRRDIAKDALPK
ncbi:MAG: phosphoribosylglycinamide synthetase C domain-containing protein, partial [Patescibacteria group bacterium]